MKLGPAFIALATFLPTLAAQTSLTTVRVASGLTRALDVQAPIDDEERIFIVEQDGRIKVLKNGKLLATPFLDVTSLVRLSSDMGLLGMAFHPRFAQNGHFFINYSRRADGANMIERYTVSTTNPDVADPASKKHVLGPVAQRYGNHNGGGLAFGKDGYLYIGFGDGGSQRDPQCNGQRGNTFLSKMLRIDVDTIQPYVVPPSNPFRNNPNVLDEIWALGLREPWRYSFDRETGDLWIGDVGQNAREEIDFQPASSKGGENYGWKVMEGTLCHPTTGCQNVPACKASTLTLPVHDYPTSVGRSVIGGYVYRGCAIPDLRGSYFFGDYASRRIWSFRYSGGKVTEYKDRTVELGWNGRMSSFGVDGRGEIYICKFIKSSSPTSEIWKIVPKAPPPVVDLGYGKVGGDGKVPKFDACGLLTSGNTAALRLHRAPRRSVSVLVISTMANPTPIFGGTLLPVPIQLLLPLVTDDTGRVTFSIPGGGGPFSIYGQYVILDAKASWGFGFSNALRIDFQR